MREKFAAASWLRELGPLHFMVCMGVDLDINLYLQGDGHRVRLATHANFEDFVQTAGLEFFPLGGDPKILAGRKCVNPVQLQYISFDFLLIFLMRTQ